MIRLWKVLVLLNLALFLGIGLGYLRWAREVRGLQDEVDRLQARAAHREILFDHFARYPGPRVVKRCLHLGTEPRIVFCALGDEIHWQGALVRSARQQYPDGV